MCPRAYMSYLVYTWRCVGLTTCTYGNALQNFCHQIPSALCYKSGEFESVHNEASRPEVARLIHGLIHCLQLKGNK